MTEDYVTGWDAAVHALQFNSLVSRVPNDGNKWFVVTQRGAQVVSGYFKNFSTARLEAEKRGYYDLGYEIYWIIREGTNVNYGLELVIPVRSI